MELRTLRYFVQTADAGTVSAAADAVHVTQPALSRQLRQLERELGTNLFDRVGGRLLLSPVGRELLPLARDILTRAERLAVAATTLSHGRLERLMLAAPATTLADVVSPFIATLEEDDPTPSVFASDALEPQAALRHGADLVITNGRPGDQLDVLALAVLPVWAYVPAGHEWFGRDTCRSQTCLRTTSLPFRRRSPHGRRSTPRRSAAGWHRGSSSRAAAAPSRRPLRPPAAGWPSYPTIRVSPCTPCGSPS